MNFFSDRGVACWTFPAAASIALVVATHTHKRFCMVSLPRARLVGGFTAPSAWAYFATQRKEEEAKVNYHEVCWSG